MLSRSTSSFKTSWHWQEWQLIFRINGAPRQIDCHGGRRLQRTQLWNLSIRLAAGWGAPSTGIVNEMSFWIWSESFFNLIPPGLAPEIQIWHVVEERKIKGNPINLCQRRRWVGPWHRRGKEHLSMSIMWFVLHIQLCLLIGIHSFVAVSAWCWLRIFDQANRRLTTWWWQNLWECWQNQFLYHTVNLIMKQAFWTSASWILSSQSVCWKLGSEGWKGKNLSQIFAWVLCKYLFSTFQLDFWFPVKINWAASVIHEHLLWFWLTLWSRLMHETN